MYTFVPTDMDSYKNSVKCAIDIAVIYSFLDSNYTTILCPNMGAYNTAFPSANFITYESTDNYPIVGAVSCTIEYPYLYSYCIPDIDAIICAHGISHLSANRSTVIKSYFRS